MSRRTGCDMVPNGKTVKRWLGAALAALLLASLVMPITPSVAASNHNGERFRFGNGNNGAPFNVDPDPCPDAGAQRRHVGRQGCYPEQGYGRRGRDAMQRPGSNAFGLQFNSDGY